MIVNETPVRTTKNYGINEVVLENDILKFENKKFENFEILNIKEEEKSEFAESFLTHKMSDELQKESENSNFSLLLNFGKTSKDVSVINFNLDDNNLIGVLNINLQENIERNIILNFESKKQSYNNFILKLNLKQNSKLKLIACTNFSALTNNFFSVEANLEDYSKLDYLSLDFGCKNSIQNFYSNSGKESTLNLYSLYLGTKGNFTDLNYIINLNKEKSIANIECVGALSSAKKNFKGTINFHKGCKKSVGSENEFCMLLDSFAKSKALPMLLCDEEDVDGKHSTSVGKVDEKQLFYLMSRGLSYLDSLKLIVKAKFNVVTQNIFDEEFKQKIMKQIDERL